jgi:hypothetical protein
MCVTAMLILLLLSVFVYVIKCSMHECVHALCQYDIGDNSVCMMQSGYMHAITKSCHINTVRLIYNEYCIL